MADYRYARVKKSPDDIANELLAVRVIANNLRGTYMPDKYVEVIIPMLIIRRIECAGRNGRAQAKHGYTLRTLCDDPEHIAANFKAYLKTFPETVRDILNELEMPSHIDRMEQGGCILSFVKAFSELDMSPKRLDSTKLGYLFESLIDTYYRNEEAGQFYTGRDMIDLCVSLLLAEGCDDLMEKDAEVSVCDQACGTGGMLFTAYDRIKLLNKTASVRLYGQEIMRHTSAVGKAEMLLRGLDPEHIRCADTLKTDCFPETKVRFVIDNLHSECPGTKTRHRRDSEKR